jgi:hypothetical protein
MARSKSQKEADRRYVERYPDKILESSQRYEEKRLPRDRREYQRQYRLKRKLEGRPVPGGSAYKTKKDD